MSKIIEMYGERKDGTKITFTVDETDKIRGDEFVSVTVREVMTPEEALEAISK